MKKGTTCLSLLLALLLAGCSQPNSAPLAASKDDSAPRALSASSPEEERPPEEPLVNYNSYRGPEDVDMTVEPLYIKVYPTYDENGTLITREEFEKHRPSVKDFNPTLNAHIWQGNPNDPTDREDRFGFEGEKYNCTIRVRGNYSRGAPVKSFKVKLTQPGATLFSTDALNFNKHIYDDTRTNNKMCMDLMQMIEKGMVSIQTRFVQLFINDVQTDGSETGFQDQGLYVWIEQPGREFLENHGLDPNGALYKPSLFEFAVTPALRAEDDPLYDEEAFAEVIEPMANPDHAKLIGMLEDLNNPSLDYNEVFNRYFDEENYLTWMAVNILFGNEDTLTHNMLLYSPVNSEKWYFLPWDYDEAMDYNDVESWGSRYYQQFGIHYFWAIPLHQRYFRIEGNIDKLLVKIDELLDTVFTQQNFDELNAGYKVVMDEYLPREPDIGMVQNRYEISGDDLFEGAGEAQAADLYEEEYTALLDSRYPAVLNNRERYELTLEYPSTIFMQEPQKVEDGWLFTWGAAFDHQQDPLTYEIILSTGYGRVAGAQEVKYEQKDIFFEKDGLTGTQIVVPELPLGPIFYRVLVSDAQGHVQYPRNVALVPQSDGTDNTFFYHAIGYFANE